MMLVLYHLFALSKIGNDTILINFGHQQIYANLESARVDSLKPSWLQSVQTLPANSANCQWSLGDYGGHMGSPNTDEEME